MDYSTKELYDNFRNGIVTDNDGDGEDDPSMRKNFKEYELFEKELERWENANYPNIKQTYMVKSTTSVKTNTSPGTNNNRYIKPPEYKSVRIVISTEEDKVGIVIGKQYKTLNKLMSEYNVDIKFKKANRFFTKPAFIISTLEKDAINIIHCSNAINRLIGIATRFPKSNNLPVIMEPLLTNIDMYNVWGSKDCVNATNPWYSR